MEWKELLEDVMVSIKSRVKNRVKNVFVLKRSCKIIITISLLLIFYLIIILCASCQPTPDEPIIKNKNENKMENAIAATPAPTISINQSEGTKDTSDLICNGHWNDSILSNSIKININADVLIPNVSAYPVSQVAPIKVDESLAKRFVDILAKNAEKIFNGSYMSKEDCESAILQLQKEINDLRNGVLPPDDKRPVKQQITDIESQLETYQKEYTNLQNDPSTKPADFTFKTDPLRKDVKDTLFINAKMQDGNTKAFQFDRYEESGLNYSSISFVDKTKLMNKNNGKSISSNQAQKLAMGLINNLGIGEFDLASEASTTNYNELIYSKSYNGIPINIVNQYGGKSGGVSENEKVNFVIGQEAIRIMINDAGIISVYWDTPCKQVHIDNENVSLLSLGQIKDIFKKQIIYNIPETDGVSQIITIKEIRLGYMIIPEKNDLTNLKTIPVWDCIGTIQSGTKTPAKIKYMSFLTINSIDGSVIDRNQGY